MVKVGSTGWLFSLNSVFVAQTLDHCFQPISSQEGNILLIIFFGEQASKNGIYIGKREKLKLFYWIM
jgi:hypothetical protein